jgi:hypothetical protein
MHDVIASLMLLFHYILSRNHSEDLRKTPFQCRPNVHVRKYDLDLSENLYWYTPERGCKSSLLMQ